MKKIFLMFCLISCLFLSSCGKKENVDDPWDNLGGGGFAEEVIEEEIDVDSLPTKDEVEDKEDKYANISTDIETIDLNNLTSTSHYTYENSVLTIKNEGVYSLSGTLKGSVVIEGDPEYVQIILNNANIETLDSQNCAAIVFKKNSKERILTIYENTINTLCDSIGDKENDDAAVIQAKKSSLIINGNGKLIINSKGEDTTGIKVKNELYIFNSNIVINAVNNGIKADSTIGIYHANLNIVCGNDAIKTDIEANNEEEGNEYTSNPFAGYIYIMDTNIEINSNDNGIDANSYLKIDNNVNNTIKITTNYGAPATITEYSSDNADGKAISVGGVKLVVNEEETDLKSQCADNYILLIKGGNYEINSNGDAISSKGNLIIDGGNYDISSGDDAIHSEYLTTIKNGDILINKCYEGIEGASVEIYDGNIKLTSSDDGINAANGDLLNYPYNIFIGGGDIQINAEGDGVDSNGSIEFKGGITLIYGPTRNDNSALDADRGVKINGGILIALGPTGMVETPSTNSNQNSLVYNLSSRVSPNTKLILKNDDNEILYEIMNPKAYQSIVISIPEFELNSSFSITTGSTVKTFTINQVITKLGNSMGPGGMGGWRPR